MIKPKPFKDAEVNSEPPQRDFQDYIELFFAFLWFHRKKIIGLALLIALAFWIRHVLNAPRQGTDGIPRVVVSSKDEIPVADINFKPKQPDATDESPEDSSPKRKPDDIAANTRPGSGESDASNLAGIENKSGGTPSVNSKTAGNTGKTGRLIESGTVEELVEESLRLGNRWGNSKPATGLLMCSQRAKIAKRLLEMELTPSQHRYALVSYIDSISLVDSLNVAGEMNLDGTRAALDEIDTKFASHPDAVIQAKANLAMTIAPLYDFLATGKRSSLDDFKTQYSQRLAKIGVDERSLKRLVDLSVSALRKANVETDPSPVIDDLLIQIRQLGTPHAIEVAKRLNEHLVFIQYAPATLAKRVGANENESRADVQSFFKSLAENPGVSGGAYQVAIDIIVAYKNIGKIDDAKMLLNRLDTISNDIPDESNRRHIKKIIEDVRKRLIKRLRLESTAAPKQGLR